MPVIGYLGAGMPETYAPLVTAIDHGLSQHPYARARAREGVALVTRESLPELARPPALSLRPPSHSG